MQTAQRFLKSQEQETFNRFNDRLTAITQHRKIKDGLELTNEHISLYRLALYDLDNFRAQLADKRIEPPLDIPEVVYEDDEKLLEFGLQFIERLFFDL